MVKYATISEQINACITSSIYWPQFQIRTLTTNMRLQNIIETFYAKYPLGEPVNDANEQYLYQQDLHIMRGQQDYGQMINMIGEGRYNETCSASMVQINNYINPTTIKYALTQTPFIHDCEEAIRQLYPNGFSTSEMTSCCIIAATNTRVDFWNKLVQDMNPRDAWILKSEDKFGSIDDPYNILSSMMTENVLNKFSNTGIPPHVLELKIGDICIVAKQRKSKNYTNI